MALAAERTLAAEAVASTASSLVVPVVAIAAAVVTDVYVML